MEDSSTNPYIPEESEKIRQAVYQRQSPLGRVVKWSMITAFVITVLVGIGLYFVIPRTEAVDTEARTKLANILQPPEQVQKQYNVESELGFSFSYDYEVFTSKAQVDTSTNPAGSSIASTFIQTYTDNELRIKRPYTYVSISPRLSSEAQQSFLPSRSQFEIFATTTSDELDKAAAVPENKDLSKLNIYVKLDTDKRKANRVNDDNTVVSIETTRPTKQTIGDIDFQRVRFKTLNENYRIPNVKYDDCYYTIQFEQPYALCVTSVRPIDANGASFVEGLVRSVKFTETSKNDKNEPTDESTVVSDELPLATLKPRYLEDADSLKAIAKTQPAVVRIGTIYCADLALKFQSGDPAASLSDACVETSSSGAIISRDGYIAASGSAMSFSKAELINGYINMGISQVDRLDRLDRVIDYMLKARLIESSVAEYLKRGAGTGEPEALAKIQNIGAFIDEKLVTITKDEYSFAVQLKEKPISINRDGNKPSFAYSDNVVKGQMVEIKYVAPTTLIDDFNNSIAKENMALLKIDGIYPSLLVADSGRQSVKSDDVINIVGYLAYSDSSLTLDSNIRDFPVASVVKVEQVYEKDGAQIINVDTPILPGNDGAPVVNSQGELVGIASYDLSYCPNNQCFANGTVRPVSELIKLIESKNIKLVSDNTISKNWNSAVNEFFRANYAAASFNFGKVEVDYPANRWAIPLQRLSSDHKGKDSDTSFMNQLQFSMIIGTILLSITTILLAIMYLIQKKRMNRLQVGHYGNMNPTATQSVINTNNGITPPLTENNSASGTSSLNQTPPPTEQVNNNAKPPSAQSESPEDPFYK
jgi:hypothetical protein